MKLIFGSFNPLFTANGCALTFGNFDGIHLGHQALLKQLKQEARILQLPVVVVLFEPQPEEFFKKNQAPARINSLRDKLNYLRACGVDYVYCMHFSSYLAQQTAEQFIENVLFTKLNAQFILLGEDARFGRARQGNVALLKSMATPLGKTVALFSNYLYENKRVSSTAVRAYLEMGELSNVAVLLGRPYKICARIKYGEGRGSKIGIATANLAVRIHKPALLGVYAVEVKKQDGGIFKGVANWGKRPTFSGIAYSLEVHGLGINENLYGQFLEVTFLKKIRNEMQFESVQELVHQIHQDIEQAKLYFAEVNRIVEHE